MTLAKDLSDVIAISLAVTRGSTIATVRDRFDKFSNKILGTRRTDQIGIRGAQRIVPCLPLFASEICGQSRSVDDDLTALEESIGFAPARFEFASVPSCRRDLLNAIVNA